MRYRIVLISCAICTLSVAKAQQLDHSTNQTERREHRQQEFLHEHMDTTGAVRPDLWQKGIEHSKSLKTAADFTALPGAAVGVRWTQIGPAPLRIDKETIFQGAGPDSGEVLDIAIDPRNSTDRVIYIATNDGGIWKTTDAGASWKPKTDFLHSLSMGAVTLDPGNPSIVYAGTGNLFDGGGKFSKGIGIYKSFDAGETWHVLNPGSIFTNVGINRIVLPAPHIVLVGTSVGVFRSVDGALNFGSNSPVFNNGKPILGGFISDLDLDTALSLTVYASVSGVGLFRSTDSGVTFPVNLFRNPGAPPEPFSFIAFAQSTRPNNRRMYASVQDGNFAGLFRSDNAGASWAVQPGAAVAGSDNKGCQCGYDQTVGVDPQNADRVYLGFQELYLSTNGGATFGIPPISRDKIHWDHHALVFSPHEGGPAPTRLYVGTDGGIATSGDGGGTWSNINETIATNLFVGIDIGRGSSFNNGYTYGGTQDTGTIEHRPEFPGADWHLGVDGDGGPPVVHPFNPLVAWGSDDGCYIKTTNGGTDWSFPTGTGLPSCGFPPFEAVGLIAVDPNNGSVLYVSSGPSRKQLFQSTNSGSTFTSVRTFPTSITSIATVKSNSNILWVGLADGTLQRTANALAGLGATWTTVIVTGATLNLISGIAIDPRNTDHVVIVYPGFSGIDPIIRTKHVFMTRDNGKTWTDISGTDGNPAGNLADLPLHSVVLHSRPTDQPTLPPLIIVSSDAGVLRSVNLGATWEVLGVGLPTVDSLKLALDDSATPSLLRIGTYGRSVFELKPQTGPHLAVQADLGFGPQCLGQSATRTVQLFNVGSTDLHISKLSSSADFAITLGAAGPFTIGPGGEVDSVVLFQSSSAGEKTAAVQISSDDVDTHELFVLASGLVQACAQ